VPNSSVELRMWMNLMRRYSMTGTGEEMEVRRWK
jgi:hypothetical protein